MKLQSRCLAFALAAALASPAARAQDLPAPVGPAPAIGPHEAIITTPSARTAADTPNRYLPNRFAGRAGVFYKAVWGIDSLKVKWAESGELIRFSWRVLDPQKAQLLNDKRIEPSLIDPQAGVSLSIPVMEKVGQLRQSQPPEAGRSYWMAFSNKGRIVRRGDRVEVVVGTFRAQYLVVD